MSKPAFDNHTAEREPRGPVDYSRGLTPLDRQRNSRRRKRGRNAIIGLTALTVPYSLGVFDAKPNGQHLEAEVLKKAHKGEAKGKGADVTVYVRSGANIRLTPYSDETTILGKVPKDRALKITNGLEYNGFVAYQPKDLDLGRNASDEEIEANTFWIDLGGLAGQKNEAGLAFVVTTGTPPTEKDRVLNRNNLQLEVDGKFHGLDGQLAAVGTQISADEVPGLPAVPKDLQLAGPAK